jgi:hypothetical protein
MQLLTPRSPPATYAASLNDRFWTIVIGQLKQLAPIADVWRLQATRGRLALALASARRGETHSAEQYLEEARRLGRGFDSATVGLVATSAIESAAAYLKYKRQQFDDALMTLEQARTVDREIKEQGGVVAWRLHGATLDSNAAHVHARQGKVIEAVDRLAAVVRGFTDTLGQSGIFCDERIRSVVPTPLLEELRIVYSDELAAMLNRFKS